MTLVVAALMALVVSVPALAQTKALSPVDEDDATITINNPANGETYELHKLFDATVGEDGTISYQCTGDIPSALSAFFTKDASNNVIPDDSILEKDTAGKVIGSKMTDGLKAALETWAASDQAIISDVSNGEKTMTFTGLPYGYYVMTTTHEDDAAAKALITVDSTKPSASIYDKNNTIPTAVKSVNDNDVYIGQTVTYTLEFGTSNWMGEGDAAKQVVKYEIKDTLPNYLSDVTVTSIKIDADGNTATENDQTSLEVVQFDSNKKIDIAWADAVPDSNPKTYKSKYPNGAKIIITYTAKVTAEANVGDADGNRNVVTLTPYVDNGTDTPDPWSETFKDDETIKTYGAAIHKVDDKGNSLKGAKFTIKGLTVTGSDGKYTVTNYDDSANAAAGTEMEVDEEGYIYILGLPSDITLSVTETEAPKGYNKLTADETLTPIKMSETTTYTSKTVYYDADGKVVHEETTGGTSTTISANYEDLQDEANVLEIENQSGTELPSTGGMGTRILYTVGGIMLVGGAIALVSKKRVASLEK